MCLRDGAVYGCGFLKGRDLGECVCESSEPQEDVAVGGGGCGRAQLWDGVVVGKCQCRTARLRGLAAECALTRGVVIGCGPEWAWLLRSSSKT